MARSAGKSSAASSVATTAVFQAPSGSRTSRPRDRIASLFSPRAKRRTSWPARAIAPPKYPPTPPAPTTATLMKPARLGDHIHRIVQESVFRGHPEERSDEGSALVGRSSRSPRLSRLRADQPDLPRVSVGQRLIVTFDGLPDRRWEGKVLAVSPGVREAADREVGEV